ncbi:hypothetical protein [Nocardia sp. NPDC057030]|uniref:hypothetical protein n=1 Tax=unclassified Nocardia TaxID=2637762 RepID=UPI0036326C77
MSTDLTWLTDGATVAYIETTAGRRRAHPVQVVGLTKRKVDVAVIGGVFVNTVTFNPGHIEKHDHSTWLAHQGDKFDPAVRLAPADDPEVIAICRQQRKDDALDTAVRQAAIFQRLSTVADARKLRDDITAYLDLVEPQERSE